MSNNQPNCVDNSSGDCPTQCPRMSDHAIALSLDTGAGKLDMDGPPAILLSVGDESNTMSNRLGGNIYVKEGFEKPDK